MKALPAVLIAIATFTGGGVFGHFQSKSQILAGDGIFDTFEETQSLWLFSDKIGSADASPIERARIAVAGPLGLSSSEVLYFVALKDSSGERLNSSCSYEVTGSIIDTRWWSITLYDSETQDYVANSIGRSSWNSEAIPMTEDGDWSLTVSSEPSEGNWLPAQSSPATTFELNLRIYDPTEAIHRSAPDIELPKVERVSC